MTSDTQRSEYVLVPREPTEAMMRAAIDAIPMDKYIDVGAVRRNVTLSTDECATIYRAMLESTPPKVGSGELDAAGSEHHEFVADPYRPSHCVNCGCSHAARIHDALASPVDHPEVVGDAEPGWRVGETGILFASPSPALEAGVAEAILDAEEAALLRYRNEDCQGDDPIRRHSWMVADARLSEVGVIRRKLRAALSIPATEDGK